MIVSYVGLVASINIYVVSILVVSNFVEPGTMMLYTLSGLEFVIHRPG